MVIFLTINMVTSPRDHVDALHPNLFSVFVMWFSSQSIPYAYFNPHIFFKKHNHGFDYYELIEYKTLNFGHTQANLLLGSIYANYS